MDIRDIEHMWKVASNNPNHDTNWHDPVVIAFANLVAAQEREACAKFCETNQVWVGKGKRGFSEWGEEEFVTGGIHQGMDYAAAIRARGTT